MNGALPQAPPLRGAKPHYASQVAWASRQVAQPEQFPKGTTRDAKRPTSLRVGRPTALLFGLPLAQAKQGRESLFQKVKN